MKILKERQELEKKHHELALQKKFLDEQQQLLDSSLAEEKKSQASRRASLRRVQQWVKESANQEEGAVGGNPEPSAASQIQLHSFQQQAASSIMADSMRDLQTRLHYCQQQSNPTLEQYTELQKQVELCRKQLERIQTSSTTQVLEAQEPRESREYEGQPATAQKSVRCLGTIPKAHPNNPQPGGKCQAFRVDEREIENKNESCNLYENPLTTTDKLSISNREQLRRLNARLNELPNTQQCTQFSIDGAIAQPFRQSHMQNNPDYCDRNIKSNRNNFTREQSVPEHQQQQSHVSYQQPSQSDHDRRRNHQVDHYAGPTQRQLAARQSFAKELPTFTGDPSEWPIFISNYEYTTEACGYTNGENMLRLQRCLRGHALETVRGRLVLPAAVPHVIETLRMR